MEAEKTSDKPKKGGFKGKRKKRSGLALQRRSRWVETGRVHISEKRKKERNDPVETKLKSQFAKKRVRDRQKNLATALKYGGKEKEGGNELTVRYQKCWTDFDEIFRLINSPKKQGVLKVRNKISRWFGEYVNDYVQKFTGKVEKNNPLFLASFLLTPYFHNLLNHIPELLAYDEIRSFTGQNFEKMNNDHRRFWQNSNMHCGVEIFSIIYQHLRVRMNPVRRADMLTARYPCSHCSHPPFTYPKGFKNHVLKVHPEVSWNKDYITTLKAKQATVVQTMHAATAAFKLEVTEEAFVALVEIKKLANAKYYKAKKAERSAFKKEWRSFLQQD